MLNTLPVHPLLQHPDLGSEAWWNLLSQQGTPLCEVLAHGRVCLSFVVRGQAEQRYFIDVYSHTAHITQQLTELEAIADSDVYVWQAEFTADWLGSYNLIATQQPPPKAPAHIRSWWCERLQESVVDVYNPLRYRTAMSSCVHYIDLKQQLAGCFLDQPRTVPNLYFWHRSDAAQPRKIWWWDSSSLSPVVSSPAALPIVLLFDGQIWAEQLSIFPSLAQLTQQQQIPAARYVLVDSVDVALRWQELSCDTDFLNAILQDLLPKLFPDAASATLIVAGQSLGGLSALYMLSQFPDRVAGVVALSSSLWWENAQGRFSALFAQALPAMQAQPSRIYLAAGVLEQDMRQDSEDFFQQFQFSLSIDYRTFQGGHDWVCWFHPLLQGIQHQLQLH